MKKISLILGLGLLLSLGNLMQAYSQDQGPDPDGRVEVYFGGDISCITDATGYVVRLTINWPPPTGLQSYDMPFVVGQPLYWKSFNETSYSITAVGALLYNDTPVPLVGTVAQGCIDDEHPLRCHMSSPCAGGDPD